MWNLSRPLRNSRLRIYPWALARHCLEHLNEEKPEGVENESVEQVAFADRILLNKTDLVTVEEIQEVAEAACRAQRRELESFVIS